MLTYYRFNMKRCSPRYSNIRNGHIMGDNQRSKTTTASTLLEGSSHHNPFTMILLPDRLADRNGLYMEYSNNNKKNNQQFIYLNQKLNHQPIINNHRVQHAPHSHSSLLQPAYGQNPWQSSLYSPRYQHLVFNSSSSSNLYLSLDYLLARALFLNDTK